MPPRRPARRSPPPRLVVTDVAPTVDGGRFPVKRVVGEPVDAEVTVFADGHDRLWAVLAHQAPGERGWTTVPLEPRNPGLDRWGASFTPLAEGRHRFRVLAWIDRFGSWVDATRRKLDAGQDIAAELLEGAALLEAAADGAAKPDAAALREAAEALRSGDTTPMTDRGGDERRSPLQLAHGALRPADAVRSATFEVQVERERALFSSWYELFPRSFGPEPGVHGTLADVEAQLDRVAELGFDILYLPPVHPIGTSFRKGPDNTPVAGPDDPGSPWAIGGPEGGHDAVHPLLGTVDDVRRLAKACDENGIELALDVALQCSPDHPWVAQHPEWFRHRPDGSIQYAENPPKKYQDIYPLDFGCEAWESLWAACLDLFLHWAAVGVRVFRVDNPHTKPFAFWELVIGEVQQRYPGTIFLSEAFTRPEPMHQLAKVGFTQSYGYFPWRQSKGELTEYFTEVSTPPSVDELRPSAWPNTPDILTYQLQGAPRELFASRVFLAATLAASYGIYGPAFELCENREAGNGKEEYLHSEKYQLRWWDLDDPRSLAPLITRLNAIRLQQRALHTQRTLRFHEVDNDALLCWSKTVHAGPSVSPDAPGDATILVVANLDPVNVQAGTTWLDLGALGLDPARPFAVHDLLVDRIFSWQGPSSYVELHPDRQPGHIFRITQE